MIKMYINVAQVTEYLMSCIISGKHKAIMQAS